MAWCFVVGFQQRVTIEFLVVEKNSVANFHKRLKMYTVSVLSVVRLHKLQTLEKFQAGLSEGRRSGRPTITVTQTLLRDADELIQDYRRITTRKPATKLSVSSGNVYTIIDALGYLKCVIVGFHKA